MKIPTYAHLPEIPDGLKEQAKKLPLQVAPATHSVRPREMARSGAVLVAPTEFGATDLYLHTLERLPLAEGGDPEGAYRRSRCYTGARPEEGAGAESSDNFHFTPLIDLLEIVYTIEDPGGELQKEESKGTLAIVSEKSSEVIRFSLPAAQLTHGEHTLRWRGECASLHIKTEDLVQLVYQAPEEEAQKKSWPYVVFTESPFALGLVLQSGGECRAAWTYFHVTSLVDDLMHANYAPRVFFLGDGKGYLREELKNSKATVSDFSGLPAGPSKDKVRTQFLPVSGEEDKFNINMGWGSVMRFTRGPKGYRPDRLYCSDATYHPLATEPITVNRKEAKLKVDGPWARKSPRARKFCETHKVSIRDEYDAFEIDRTDACAFGEALTFGVSSCSVGVATPILDRPGDDQPPVILFSHLDGPSMPPFRNLITEAIKDVGGIAGRKWRILVSLNACMMEVSKYHLEDMLPEGVEGEMLIMFRAGRLWDSAERGSAHNAYDYPQSPDGGHDVYRLVLSGERPVIRFIFGKGDMFSVHIDFNRWWDAYRRQRMAAMTTLLTGPHKKLLSGLVDEMCLSITQKHFGKKVYFGTLGSDEAGTFYSYIRSDAQRLFIFDAMMSHIHRNGGMMGQGAYMGYDWAEEGKKLTSKSNFEKLLKAYQAEEHPLDFSQWLAAVQQCRAACITFIDQCLDGAFGYDGVLSATLEAVSQRFKGGRGYGTLSENEKIEVFTTVAEGVMLRAMRNASADFLLKERRIFMHGDWEKLVIDTLGEQSAQADVQMDYTGESVFALAEEDFSVGKATRLRYMLREDDTGHH